ncbi:MAG: hypothetical protein AAFR63_01605 [Cyanobacteria bacterium J06631_6]
MSNKSQPEIALLHRGEEIISDQPSKISSKQVKIEIRELDRRYTHANPKKGLCTMEGCNHKATHWLTRINANQCQSDMVCNHHAAIWIKVKYLISQSCC